MLQMHSLAAAYTKLLFGLDRVILCFFVQTNCKSLFSLLQNCADVMSLASITAMYTERVKISYIHPQITAASLNMMNKGKRIKDLGQFIQNLNYIWHNLPKQPFYFSRLNY